MYVHGGVVVHRLIEKEIDRQSDIKKDIVPNHVGV